MKNKKFGMPISWHGDGFPGTSAGKSIAKTFEAYSWSGLLARGSSIQAKLYTFRYMADNVEDETSLAPIWRKVVWSFDAAEEGIRPTHDEF